MRKAFTLVEMMVVVAIIGLMLTVGVTSISAGRGAARVKGATRDVYASIRHARSTAIVTGRRVIVNYANEKDDEGPIAKVEVVSARIMNADAVVTPQPYYVEKYKDLPKTDAVAAEKDPTAGADSAEQGGETVEDILFAPISADVVRGMRLKVVKGGDDSSDETDAQKSHRISVSSNVDWLLRIYKGERAKKSEGLTASGSTSDTGTTSQSPSEEEDSGPVSVVWQTNGAVEPHDVWVYADGQKPEDGLLLRIDRFGGVKVLNGNGDDESD